MRPSDSCSVPPCRPPPPPPRPLHHGATQRPPPPAAMATARPPWLPRGPPMTGPFPSTQHPFSRPPPPPPWAMPPRPAAPHSFSMRPPMQPAFVHRPPPPPSRHMSRFGSQSRPNMRPPLDPDAQWLAAFTLKHLNDDGTTVRGAIDDREPPLRQIRARLAEILTKLSELETRAHELVELEEKVLNAESREDELVLARLKVQSERTRKDCEQLRAQLDELQNPKPFGIGPEMHRDTLAFTKRTQKKKAHRLRQKQKLRAECTIRDKLQEQESHVKNKTISQDGAKGTVDEAIHTEVDGPNNSTVARRDRQRECEAARKVLLALELREARRGVELTETERQEILGARELATACLRRKRKRKRRRTSPTNATECSDHSSADTTAVLPAMKQSLMMPLRDPYATDMETLISVRRQWDAYVMPHRVNGASAIPPHFVMPPDKPSAPWAHFAMQSHVDEPAH